ncbi:ATP/GTP-binding protein [Vibrio sp. 10N.222.49.A3]|uniref:AAA family ATPase n=1 Tax=Vibrio sp. 10N.222.49.A3 TaxID=3229611 RepID=UPI003550D084
MLVRFRVSNYKSINNEVTLNLTPSTKVRRHSHHVGHKSTNYPALRGALIYGANASGKSSICDAMDVASALIQDELIDITPFDSKLATKFEYEFTTDEQTYAYGFEYFSGEIIEEWLYLITDEDNEKVIFCYGKDTDNKLSVGDFIVSSLDDESNLYLKFLFRSRDTKRLFMPQTIRNKDEDLTDFTDKLKPVIYWFMAKFEFITPDAAYMQFEDDLLSFKECEKFYSTFLRAFDTGISEIKLSQHTFDDLTEALQIKINQIIEENHDNLGGEWGFVLNTPFGRVNVTVNKENKIEQIYEVVYKNSCKDALKKFFKYHELSDGTRRLIDIIPALYKAIHHEKVFVIDEIDRSIHPIIIKIILEYFFHSNVKPNGQLIVTTHDTGVMEQEFLRKDEIWFVQKEHDGSSLLYALDEYSNDLRNDKSIIKDYLNGRYGAVVNYKKAKSIVEELLSNG